MSGRCGGVCADSETNSDSEGYAAFWGEVMANSFICSDCQGDGTRCRCHEKRGYVREESQLDKIFQAQQRADAAQEELNEFLRKNLLGDWYGGEQ